VTRPRVRTYRATIRVRTAHDGPGFIKKSVRRFLRGLFGERNVSVK
jgi:hypothetical protein